MTWERLNDYRFKKISLFKTCKNIHILTPLPPSRYVFSKWMTFHHQPTSSMPSQLKFPLQAKKKRFKFNHVPEQYSSDSILCAGSKRNVGLAMWGSVDIEPVLCTTVICWEHNFLMFQTLPLTRSGRWRGCELHKIQSSVIFLLLRQYYSLKCTVVEISL